MAQEKALQLTLNLDTLSPEEQRQLLHELRVHQIELEMQNESLRRTREELESSRVRYFNLYDLAPVGYFTLSEEGLILEANLTASSLLGVVRSALVKKSLTRFIFREDQDIYYHHRKQLFETSTPQVCELRLVKKDGSLFWVRLESTVAQNSESGDTLCYTVISDFTERKKIEEQNRHIKQVILAVRNVNQLIVQGNDPERLIDQACQILTKTLGYCSAWIALLDEGNKVTSTASFGFGDGFTILEEQLKQGKYPLCMEKVFQEKEAIVIDNSSDGCTDCPLYSGHVGRAGLSSRIQYGDKYMAC